MPKFLGLFSKSGLTTFFGSAFFTAKGAAATFFPTFFLGYKNIFSVRYLLWVQSKIVGIIFILERQKYFL
jgi:hypothetical protein